MKVQSLMSLPVEVLSRILMYVDSSDISAVKKTCQTLCSITMTRQFWHNRIRQLCEEHVASPPEEELEKYTIAELEQWTMRRIRARNTSPVKLKFRRRKEPETDYYCQDMLLVPGGRWLLKVCNDSRVYFVDLDSRNLEQHLLLDPRNTDPRISHCRKDRSYIWMDRKAPRLSFRLEGSFYHGEGDRRVICVYIYQVNLIGHGASATLVAQIIATFQINTSEFSNAFNDHYFVLEKGQGLEIFDYRQAFGCFDYPLVECHTLASEDYPVDFEFINEDVLAVYYSTPPSYHILHIESSTSLQFLHEIQIPEHCSYRVRWTPKATLITFGGDEYLRTTTTLQRIVIPHERSSHPRIVELGNVVGETIPDFINVINDVFYFILRLRHSGRTDKISRRIYEWDYTCESPRGILTHISILDNWGSDRSGLLFDLDEDTGRFVHLGDDKLNIVDIDAAG